MQLVTRATHGRPVEHKPRSGEAPEVWPKGRKCSAKHACDGKTLSVFNRGPNCFSCDEALAEPSALTKAQRQIIKLARRGYSNAEIAEVIDSAPNSVANRVSELRKIGVELPYEAEREELRQLMEQAAA